MVAVGVGHESFDDGLTALGKWTFTNVTLASAGGISGNYGIYSNGAESGMALTAAEEHATCIMGGHVYRTTGSVFNDYMCFRSDAGVTVHVTVGMTTLGAIEVRRGVGGTLLGSTGPNVIAHDTWYHLEALVTLSDAAGVVQVWVDDVMVLNLSGLDTKNGGTKVVFDYLSFNGRGGGFTNPRGDNHYMNNAAGAVNNGARGAAIVEVLIANGAGDLTQWTAVGAATNWQAVATSDGDTSYVEEATLTEADTYQFSDLAAAAGTIPLVVLRHLAKHDGTPVNIQQRVRRAAANSDGPTITPPASYGALSRLLDQDPIAAAAWTIANVNTTQFGQEAVA